MQHRQSKIRQTYDEVFEQTESAEAPNDAEKVDEDDLKKQIVRKYLDGELTEDMMTGLLKTLGDDKKSGGPGIAYG